jgi:phage nucleotide-binding protein
MMAIKITTTKDYGVSGVKVLVYSAAGVGKTVLSSTAPNPLIISAESGLLSLQDHDIPVIEVKSVEDVNDVYEWVTSSKEAGQYETLCLDSVTEIAEVLLSEFKAETKDARQAYGQLADEMSKTIRSFRDLKGKNVYFTAKMVRAANEDGITVYYPMMPGKTMTNGLSFFFDEVFALRIGKLGDGTTYRYLQTQPDLQYDAKDRSGRLKMVEEPDLTKVFNKIRMKKENDNG